MILFKIIYWAGLLIQIVIRFPYRNSPKVPKAEQRESLTERTLLGLLTLGGVILPLVYSLTGWLDFANYHLPPWASWLGVFLLACGLFIFWRAHTDLKSNWSPTLEIYKEHSLVTSGIYGSIRHPMYASQWVTSIAQALLLQNWLAGPIGLIVFIPFYFLRVGPEEKMMLDHFGDEYRRYMQKTGSVIPKF